MCHGFKMFLECLTTEQLSNIYNECNATEESVKRDVEYLMEWLEKEPSLPNIKDTQLLTNFLLRCKNSVEKAKQRLDYYYTTRAIMPEIFTNRDPLSAESVEVLKIGGITPLPKLTPEGRRVLFIHFYKSSGRNLNPEQVLKNFQMACDVMLKYDQAVELIVVNDYENISISVIALAFTILRTFIQLGTRTTPYRFQKIYYVNVLPAVQPLINFSKTLLPKKLASRLEIWKKKPTDLFEVLPKDILPSNYGGTEKRLEELADLWVKQVQDEREWFKAEDDVKADLSKRPNGGEFCNDLGQYGVEGSFRKMCLD